MRNKQIINENVWHKIAVACGAPKSGKLNKYVWAHHRRFVDVFCCCCWFRCNARNKYTKCRLAREDERMGRQPSANAKNGEQNNEQLLLNTYCHFFVLSQWLDNYKHKTDTATISKWTAFFSPLYGLLKLYYYFQGKWSGRLPPAAASQR